MDDDLGGYMPGSQGSLNTSDPLHWMQQNARKAQSLGRIVAL